MNKNYVMDLFGVLRNLGWACLATGLLMFAVAVLPTAVIGTGPAAVRVGMLPMFLGLGGAMLVIVASLTRWLVARMKFYSEQPRPVGG